MTWMEMELTWIWHEKISCPKPPKNRPHADCSAGRSATSLNQEAKTFSLRLEGRESRDDFSPDEIYQQLIFSIAVKVV